MSRSRAFVWCGPAFMLLLLAGLLAARWIVPPHPTETADQIASMYQVHRQSIRVGILLGILGGTLFAPFAVAITESIRRLESAPPLLSGCQSMLGGLLVLEVIVPLMVLATAALRPDRPAEQIQMLNDVGWVMFVGLVSTAALEIVVTGLAVLASSAPGAFPRWFGGYSLVAAGFVLLGALDIFGTTGPFAWNGALSWWGALVAFGTWLVGMTVFMLRESAVLSG